ncbi:MAG TPA: hypothetical protein VM324_01485 [Egibacteraceae bacterium]|nr:hypothetical protein [Egibacteraceae bacterium]
MSLQAPARAVSRLGVLGGALVLVALLAGVVGVAEALRHPHADVQTATLAEMGDVRDEVVCPDAPAAADDGAVAVGSGELHDCPALYDGLRVRYEGEVVGALLSRRGVAWTQLNDDDYAGVLGPLPAHRVYRGSNAGVGVLLPTGVAEVVEWVGGPAARGDVLVVTGTFHRVDPASREVAVIRADSAVTSRPGGPAPAEPLPARRVLGIVLGIAAAGVTAGPWLLRRWSR